MNNEQVIEIINSRLNLTVTEVLEDMKDGFGVFYAVTAVNPPRVVIEVTELKDKLRLQFNDLGRSMDLHFESEICLHENSESVKVSGDERITICYNCGKEL